MSNTLGIEGTEDWIEVVHVDFGEPYEWDIFAAYYSPSQRMWFWDSAGGCSCNYWEPTFSDFRPTDRDGVLRAIRDNITEVGTAIDATSAVRIFREPKLD